jgi:hypothetical protein
MRTVFIVVRFAVVVQEVSPGQMDWLSMVNRRTVSYLTVAHHSRSSDKVTRLPLDSHIQRVRPICLSSFNEWSLEEGLSININACPHIFQATDIRFLVYPSLTEA